MLVARTKVSNSLACWSTAPTVTTAPALFFVDSLSRPGSGSSCNRREGRGMESIRMHANAEPVTY
jgi:hypothetical protein